MKRLLPAFLLLFSACGGEEADAGASDVLGSDSGAPDKDGGVDQDAATTDLGTADAGEQPPGEWFDLEPLPVERQECGVATVNGELYVIGGYGAGPPYEFRLSGLKTEIYDPVANSWRMAADLPASVHHPNVGVVDGKIYVLNYLGTGFQDQGRVFVYDPALGTWDERDTSPISRRRGASAVASLGGFLYVIGGLRGGSPVADFDEYDPILDEWRPLPPLPRAMDHGVAGVIDGKIYVAGGRASGNLSDDLDIYDPSTGEWTRGPDMPTARAGTSGAVLGGLFYVFGGEGNSGDSERGMFEEAEVFDPLGNVWYALPPMPRPRHGTGAAAIGDRIYIPGGADRQGFGSVASNQAFLP